MAFNLNESLAVKDNFFDRASPMPVPCFLFNPLGMRINIEPVPPDKSDKRNPP